MLEAKSRKLNEYIHKAKEMEVLFQENVVRVNIKTYSSSFSNVKHSHEKKSPRTTVHCTDYSIVFFPSVSCQNANISIWMMR